jgi:nitrogen fixation protein FixH
MRPRGWWYPWLFVAGMLLVIVVNGVLLTLAIGTFPGLTTEDAYRKGLAYNRTLDAVAAQAQRGWRLDLALDPEAEPWAGPGVAARPLTIVARFVDEASRPVNGLAVEAMVERPVGAGGRLSLDLDAVGDGVYRRRVDLPAAGQWDVRVLARRGDETFQESRRFVLR